MIDSVAAAQFSAGTLASEIKQKLAEYALCANIHSDSSAGQQTVGQSHEGGMNNLEEKIALLHKSNVTQEQLQEMNIDLEEITIEELEEVLKSMSDSGAEGTKADHSQAGEPDDHDDPAGSDVKMFVKIFTQADMDAALGKQKSELDAQFSATGEALREANEKLANAQKAVSELAAFKSEVLAARRDLAEQELFGKFEKDLSADPDYIALKEKSKDFSLEELNEKCFAIWGKAKSNFTASQSKSPAIRVPFNRETPEETSELYGGLFAKHATKK